MTCTVIALDENGSEYSSRDFSNVVYKGLEDGGANLTFVIGGFAGLPSEIKKSYPLISLSKVFTTSDKRVQVFHFPIMNIELPLILIIYNQILDDMDSPNGKTSAD
jgi:Predicted SPOUT methyltransferase